MGGRRVVVLLHVPFEGPGSIADWAKARGHALAGVALHRGEIGWFPLRWDARAREVPSFSHVPDASTVFHWHGDAFTLPEGMVALASSDACASQGFASPDGRAIGLQFHLEMREEDVRSLVENGRDEILPGGRFVQAEADILGGHARHGAPLRALLETILDRWLGASG